MILARPISVSLTSALTAAGSSAEQTAASIRAAVVPILEDPGYMTISGDEAEAEPARTARVAGVDPGLDGRDRLFALLDPVLADLVERAPEVAKDAHRTALFVALPEPDAVTSTWSLKTFAPDLEKRLGLSFASVQSSLLGRAGVFALLAEARALLARGGAELAVVAGVDSLVSPLRLRLFDEEERLRSPRNVDGFFPGEGAALALLSSERRLSAHGWRAELSILGVGLGSEPEGLRSDKPSTGRGLTDALRGALADAAPVRWVVSDYNGESYRAYEWGLVHARLAERLDAISLVSHPARSTGDVGAATGAVQIALASAGFRRGWAQGTSALVFAGSDGAERAALRLGKP
jgi:3-oxoacyl-[acyl-carrier-protein] synthase I